MVTTPFLICEAQMMIYPVLFSRLVQQCYCIFHNQPVAEVGWLYGSTTNYQI